MFTNLLGIEEEATRYRGRNSTLICSLRSYRTAPSGCGFVSGSRRRIPYILPHSYIPIAYTCTYRRTMYNTYKPA
jgi:hypothetical protein